VHSNPHDTLVFQYRATLDETKMQQATEQIDTLALESSTPSEQHPLQLMDLSPEVLMTIHDYLPQRDLIAISQLNRILHVIARRRLALIADPIIDVYWPKLHQLVSDGGDLLARTERLTWDTTLRRIPNTICNLKMLHVMYAPGNEAGDVEFVSVLARFRTTLHALVVSYNNTSPQFYLSDAKDVPEDLSLNLETLIIRANIPYAESLCRATKPTLKHLITCGQFDDTERYPELRFVCRVMRPQRVMPTWVWSWPISALSVWPKMVLSMRIEIPDVRKYNVILHNLRINVMLDLVNKLDDPQCDECKAVKILIDFLNKHKSLVCLPAFIDTCHMIVQCSLDCFYDRDFPKGISHTEHMFFPWESYIAIIFEYTGGKLPLQVAMVLNTREPDFNRRRETIFD
jgi:hypothetical protein